MAVTEERRHGLYSKLEEVIGTEHAATAMELLPPVGWADVATKRDLEHFADKLRVEWGRDMRTWFLANLAANSALLAIAFVIARGV